MIVTTTPSIEGKRILEYCGVVFGIERTDSMHVFNAQSNSKPPINWIIDQGIATTVYQSAMCGMIERAEKLGADAIVAVNIDYEMGTGSFLLVAITGTAVRCE